MHSSFDFTPFARNIDFAFTVILKVFRNDTACNCRILEGNETKATRTFGFSIDHDDGVKDFSKGFKEGSEFNIGHCVNTLMGKIEREFKMR